jgi:ketosteroid isomerase-like protein
MRRLAAIAACGLALSSSADGATGSDAAAVVDSFHWALARGDTKAAAALLADDVLVFEAGGAERGKAEYAAQHLSADADFSRAVKSTTMRRANHQEGGIAWIATEGRTTGKYHGRPIDQLTAETMILRHTAEGWKIVHVHWSSAAARDSADPAD